MPYLPEWTYITTCTCTCTRSVELPHSILESTIVGYAYSITVPRCPREEMHGCITIILSSSEDARVKVRRALAWHCVGVQCVEIEMDIIGGS